MKSSELDSFRVMLVDKRADLLDRVRAARSSETDSDEKRAPDLGDRALSSVSRELSYQLTGGEREVLRRIDAALDRMEKGSYGDCLHCGRAVQTARLRAVPWARHCIDCQELQDRGEI